MIREGWSASTPDTEGVYEMKSPDGSVEVVEVRDLAIDSNPARPLSLHAIHVNGPDPEDPNYYSINSFGQCDQCSWRRIGDLPTE